jgi:hypothetical protein
MCVLCARGVWYVCARCVRFGLVCGLVCVQCMWFDAWQFDVCGLCVSAVRCVATERFGGCVRFWCVQFGVIQCALWCARCVRFGTECAISCVW